MTVDRREGGRVNVVGMCHATCKTFRFDQSEYFYMESELLNSLFLIVASTEWGAID